MKESFADIDNLQIEELKDTKRLSGLVVASKQLWEPREESGMKL